MVFAFYVPATEDESAAQENDLSKLNAHVFLFKCYTSMLVFFE